MQSEPVTSTPPAAVRTILRRCQEIAEREVRGAGIQPEEDITGPTYMAWWGGTTLSVR